jgi:hypothetical protein
MIKVRIKARIRIRKENRSKKGCSLNANILESIKIREATCKKQLIKQIKDIEHTQDIREDSAEWP